MQIAVDQSLGVIHKIKFQLGRFQPQRLIPVNFPLYKVCQSRNGVVFAAEISHGVGVNQLFSDAAQVRIDVPFYLFLFLLVIHGHVCGSQGNIRQVG